MADRHTRHESQPSRGPPASASALGLIRAEQQTAPQHDRGLLLMAAWDQIGAMSTKRL